MPAVFGKIGRTFPAARGNGAPRPAPSRLAEKVPIQPGGGTMALRDWLAQAQRDLPEWDELRTDGQRFAALEKMFADDAVKAAFLTKLFNVSSLDWNVTPALPDDPRSRQTADFHLFNLQGARGGTRGVVEEILLPGLVRGNSVCEMVARPEPEPDGPWRGKRCLSELKAKPHVQVEEDQFGNPTAIVAQTKDGPQKYDPADGFVLFKFLPLFGKPTSDFRAAYRAYRAKAMIVNLWLIGLEKFGQPFFKGKYPAGDTTGLRAQLETALEQVRSRTFVSLPDGTDVEPVQILSGNHAYYQQALDSCDRAIFVAIAGAFLQNITSANRGGPDQRGDSQVQQTTSELFVWHLASCVADTCNDQIIPYWHRLNFAGGGLPKAALGGVNDADLRPGADLDKTLTEIGLPLSKKDAYARYDRVPPSGPDDVLGGGAAVPPGLPAPFAEPEQAAAPPLPPGLDVGPLMTVREVCRALRVSRGKVKTLTDGGELKYKRFGTTIRVPQRAVAEYLTKCEGAPAGGGAAVPFSDAAEFCGGKGGKPGPCPEGGGPGPAVERHGYTRAQVRALTPGQRKALARRVGAPTKGKTDKELTGVLEAAAKDAPAPAASAAPAPKARKVKTADGEADLHSYQRSEAKDLPQAPALLAAMPAAVQAAKGASKAGTAGLADVYAGLKAKNPALTVPDFHRQLLAWEQQDVLTLQRTNDPRLLTTREASAALEVMPSSPDDRRAGIVAWIDFRGRTHADAARFCMVGANAGKPGPCPENLATPAHKDALAAHAQNVNKTLTSSERGAVSDYIAGLDESVNESLRAGKMPTDRDERDIVKGLDGMFAKAPPLKEPVNVHRGIRLGTPEKQAAFLADLEAKQAGGAPVEFKAYGSTTTDAKVAEGFLRNKPGGVVFDIEATHGVDVSGLTQVKQAAKEAEFLLPRGSEFDVVGVEPGEPARVRLRQRPKAAAASERPFAEGLDGAGGAMWFARRAQGQGQGG